ncbi:MAG: CocE/NonD family hydrolase [Hyphomonadaceae bacterium]|nr:CocE/NonD family hydrolase [Hyphomonadaceae bacterium]
MTSHAQAHPAAVSTRHSAYVAMRDGVRLAVEIWLPPGTVETAERVTTLCWFTRYWRAMLRDGPEPRAYGEAVAQAGFAFVHVDARGSGASFGVRLVEYSDDEVADMGEIIDWIAAQPWSDGRVATGGVSYVGNTAELAASLGRPALCAAVPQFTDYDFFDQILFPGGLLNRGFVDSWGQFVRALDRNDIALLRTRFAALGFADTRGVKPVDGAETALADALADHEANGYYLDACRSWTFRDDVAGVNDSGALIRRKPLFTYARALEQAQTPMLHWIGWLDSATAAGALARFAALDAPNTILIGPWTHGATARADVFDDARQPVVPSPAAQRALILRYIADAAAGRPGPGRCVIYYTMGEGAWRRTRVWPPRTVSPQTLFLHADGALRDEAPTAREATCVYVVDVEAGTGDATRWTTSMGGGPVAYGDRVAADARLLTFTAAPLDAPLAIVGAPQVTLELSSSHADIAVIAYLEAVAPDGQVRYLTEGALRAVHRRIHPGRSPHDPFAPNRSFLRADAWPLTPGEPATLTFNLIPTAVRVPAGWRMRLALAGADKDTFARIPADGRPEWRLFAQSDAASWLVLPVDSDPAPGDELERLLW